MSQITTCPHCGAEHDTRDEFLEHMAEGCNDESRLQRAREFFDRFLMPTIVAALGLIEYVVGGESVGLAFLLIAVLWMRQNE